MVYERGIIEIGPWLLHSSMWLLIIVLGGAFLGLLFGFLVSAAQHGPAEGFYRTAKVVFSAFASDLPSFSLRRTLAIAYLAIQESMRKRVLMTVMGVFIVILLFAGWFLDPRADNPARLYLSFVLSTSNLLVLFMSIFLATLSLPNDMKSKTIYTVVTKPVRASEIVLGRVIGFAGVGTVLLFVMMVLSYLFVTRGLTHEHQVVEDSVREVKDKSGDLLGYEGRTTENSGHEHTFTVKVDPDHPGEAEGATDLVKGHRHKVTRRSDGTFLVGPAEGQLEARVPVYAKLSWLDNSGKPTEKGISVGSEWDYRHYISGGTKSAAIYTFSGLKREQFPNGIPLEMTIRVFRTYKGDIEKNVLGSITLRNPNEAEKKQSAPLYHRFKEFETDSFEIPLKVARLPEESSTRGSETKVLEPYDLFEDLVNESGRLDVIIKCEEPSQYYGVAQPDIYIRASDRLFITNFFKCFVTFWLEMIIVVAFGVMFSTFLSGPIAFVGTISALVVGFFIGFVREIVEGMFNPQLELGYKGGGPIESFIRIVTQQNIQTDLEVGSVTNFVVKIIDQGFALMLYASTFVVPTFGDFDTVRFVSYGYNIDAVLLSTLCLQTLAYALGASIVAYFVLKTREIAQ